MIDLDCLEKVDIRLSLLMFHIVTDSSAKKLKGVIDLDCLEQVDSGLTFESGKVKYQVS